VGWDERARIAGRAVLVWFGLHGPRQLMHPMVAGWWCILATSAVLYAALGSGSTSQWVLAAFAVVIAAGAVWQAWRDAPKRRPK